jgi:hypothetical protein
MTPEDDRPGTARVAELTGRVQLLGMASAAAVAERYVAVVERFLARRPSEGVLGDALGLQPGAVPGPETLELPAAHPGTRSTASLWLHNPTAAPVSAVVQVGRLTSADGLVLPAGAVVSASAPTDRVAPGASAEVRLLVNVPQDTPAGHFHAVVTSAATPRQALLLHLEVLDRGFRP